MEEIKDTENIKGLIDSYSIKETMANIRFQETEGDISFFTSDHFLDQAVFKDDLFNPFDHINTITSVCDEEVTAEYSDHVVLHGWKNVENISSRLISTYDNIVLLECLIDREEGIYEEREFSLSLFEGYEINTGSLFYLRVFERPHEIRIEVHNDPGLTHAEDFPSIDFKELYNKSLQNK
jgi:hypothetical protein